MENIILIIILYFIGSLVSDKTNKKRRGKKQNRDEYGDGEAVNYEFEIPRLDGAPEVDTAYEREESKEESKYLGHLNADDKKRENQGETLATQTVSSMQKEPVVLTKENVKTGIILSEILNKPKAYRRLRRY